MKYIILSILISFTSSVNAQNNINIYDSIFSQNKVLKDNNMSKELFAKYLSSDENPIIASNIDTVIMSHRVYIKNYGEADLITVILNKTIGKILSSKFLIIVNHSTKRLSNLNLDQYYLVKTSFLDKGVQIMAIRNFRGNIQLSIYNFLKTQFWPIFFKNIFKNTDCEQYKFGTLYVQNVDINNDKRLDLSISYKINHFCDKNGNETDSPLYETIQFKKLIFRSKGELENWNLKYSKYSQDF